MKCFRCHTELGDNATFCSECGEPQGFPYELIKMAEAGGQDAITQLYNSTYNNVYFTIKSMVKDEDAILDILQDSYLKAFNNLWQLQDPNKFRPWIKRIAHNNTVDYLRKTKSMVFSQLSDDETLEFEDDRTENLPEMVIDQQETTRLIGEILNSLSEDQRVVIGMFYYEQMSIREISESLGVNENTVKSRLNYGKKKIELKVAELEKSGIKLYNMTPITLLMVLFLSFDRIAPAIPSMEGLHYIFSTLSAGKTAGNVAGNVAGNIAGNTAGNAAGNVAGNVAGNIAATAGKTAISGVAKGISAKVISIVCVTALAGAGIGAFAVHNAKKNKSEDKKTEQVVTESTVKPGITESTEEAEITETTEIASTEAATELTTKVNEEEIYAPIFNEYKAAMADVNGAMDAYPDVNAYAMKQYYQYSGTDEYSAKMYSAYYDIDGNGVNELLIGYGSKVSVSIVDIYAIREVYAVKQLETFEDKDLKINIYNNGSVVTSYTEGMYDVVADEYKMSEDGTSLEMIRNVANSNTTYSEESIDEYINNQIGQVQINDYQWKELVMANQNDTAGTTIEGFTGTYMNGNDWNAGSLDITKIDAEHAKVVLQGYKDFNNLELEVAFEGNAVLIEEGLKLDISGETVLIKKGVDKDTGYEGLNLEVPEALRKSLGFDNYIYDGMYFSIY